MKHFVFSADSHVLEPNTLFLDGLPASLKNHAVYSRKEGDYVVAGTADKTIYRIRLSPRDKERPFADQRRGLHDIAGRMEDMATDGVDAEICFPTLGLWLYCLDNADAEAASCRVYNDWHSSLLGGNLDRFVRCGMLPVRDLSASLEELRYLASKGFTAAMLPAVVPPGLPKYNDPVWDPVFALAGELEIVLVMHTGTGLESVQSERGPGGAIINYSTQAMDAMNTTVYLVAGGVLDRNPKAKVAFIESGASWLSAIGERMDEVSEAHDQFVRPKLSLKPSEIINRQIWASFQHDRACILTRRSTPNLLFATDYPHAEGTFPRSRNVVDKLFEGTNASEDEKADILGRNALKLFRLPHPVLNPV